MTAFSDSSAHSQRDVIKDIRSSLIPSRMEEKYRCMVVWDTRTNRDVGWLMVRKEEVDGMKAEEVEASMSQCQWRNWNLKKIEESCVDEECRNTTGMEMDSNTEEDVVGKDSDEASTSTEAKRESVLDEKVTQVKADLFLRKDSFEVRSCTDETFLKEPLLKTSLGSLTEIESSVFDKMEGIKVSVDNINKSGEEQVPENNSAHVIDESSSERQLENNAINTIKSYAEEFHINEVIEKQVSKESLLRPSLGKLAEIESFTLEKMDVIEVSVNQNKSGEEQAPEVDEIIIKRNLPFESSNKRKSCKKIASKKIKTSAEEMHVDEVVERQVQDTRNVKETTQTISKDSKGILWKKYCDNLRDCPECGKLIKQKSFIMHLLIVHKIKSVLTNCNMCKKKIAEDNLLMHRKHFHPERFKSDIITCSGCQNQVRAVDFDSHECGAEEVEIEGVDEEIGFGDCDMTDVDLNASTRPSQDLLSETCSDCHVAFAGDEIRYHDCKRISVVRIKRLNVETEESKAKTQIELEVGANGGNFMCEDCGQLFDTNERIIKHSCICMWKDESSDERVEMVNELETTGQRDSQTSVSLASAQVTEQPPQLLWRGEMFNFTIKLLGSGNSSLLIQSVCLTACSASSVLQFRLQLLQADGSITLQPLWLSVCSNNQPAGLLKRLVPHQTACRLLGRDLLQFSISCDQICAATDTRFKLVVTTSQMVLCYTREMFVYNYDKFGSSSVGREGEMDNNDRKITDPKQIQQTKEDDMVPQPSSEVYNAVCDDGEEMIGGREMEAGDLM